MKWLIAFLILSCSVFSCSDKKESPSFSAVAAGIPAGAEQVAYPEEPNLIKVTVRDNEGKAKASGLYRDQQRDGVWVEYQQKGIVKSMISYHNGLKEGAAIEITENGQVAKQYNHHHDVLDGEYKEFNYSTLKEERFYINGKLEGTVKIYYPDGKVMEEGNYKNGIRDGVSKWYDKDGNLSIEYEYKEGALIKK